MKQLVFIITITLFLFSCESEQIKENGEKVGKAATNFVKGVNKGVKESLKLNIQIPDEIKVKGLTTGKYSVKNINGGRDNLLKLYCIFDKDFSEKIIAKAFDTEGLEAGRAITVIEASTDEARYIEFEFNKETNIGSNWKIEFAIKK